jgi:signal transduction histidine kinase
MSIYRSRLADTSPFLGYGVATALIAAAAFLRVGMSAFVTRPLSAPLFLTVIIFCVWSGGFRLGLYASLVSGLVISYFFAQPAVGSLTPYDHVIRAGLFLAEGALVSWLMNKLRLASDELEDSREELRELTTYQRTQRDDELKKISREIHDELGEALTSLKLDIHMLKRSVQTGQDAEQTFGISKGLDDVSTKVDATIEKVRRISSEMRPSILDDFGLVAALDWQTTDYARRTGLKCSFVYDSENVSLDSDSNTAVFRIFQEALTNVTRHANASEVSVSLTHDNGDICLLVKDDGVGIKPTAIKGTRSLGLLGMRERARLISADIDIHPASEKGGTVVRLTVPLEKNGAGEIYR